MVQRPVAQLPCGYAALLKDIKARVRAAQLKAGLAVNRELVLLYWHIGREILARQKQEGWGAKVIDRLSRDLSREFPEMSGLSPRNLKYMRAFAEAWPEEPFVQQLAAQMPWFHNCVLLDKVADTEARRWYVRATVEHGWSRNVLVHQIETDLYRRQGKALTNFKRTLPAPQSDLAQQVLKDPYTFDFLTLGAAVRERDIEQGLVRHVARFLLELGSGFAFVGEQYRFEVSDKEFFVDLLLYHTRLHCYVVVELKAGEFKPEHTGQLNFYLSAVDDRLKTAGDNPSIGILLCAAKDKLIVEYALRDVKKPIGVAEWRTRLVRTLPRQYKGSLPTIEELEAELTGGAKTPAAPKKKSIGFRSEQR
ncbi:MAG: PDDEXK nuclease domain-containing protein [candidate division WOR-3 bacterium]|nr:PDDEXK nuclease domain-containing protein [candidate division WOR-3 bacterium]